MSQLSITYEYNISLLCYSCDPIYDLSFRIGHLLKTNLFFKQNDFRIHYSDNGTAIYDITLCANDEIIYKKELVDFNRIYEDDEEPIISNLIVKLDKNICGHTTNYLNTKNLQKFILQQVRSILLINVSISDKQFSIEDNNIICCFTLKLRKS